MTDVGDDVVGVLRVATNVGNNGVGFCNFMTNVSIGSICIDLKPSLGVGS